MFVYVFLVHLTFNQSCLWHLWNHFWRYRWHISYQSIRILWFSVFLCKHIFNFILFFYLFPLNPIHLSLLSYTHTQSFPHPPSFFLCAGMGLLCIPLPWYFNFQEARCYLIHWGQTRQPIHRYTYYLLWSSTQETQHGQVNYMYNTPQWSVNGCCIP